MTSIRTISEIYRGTRRWFYANRFLEVRTNALGAVSGFDGYVRPFLAEYLPPRGPGRRLFLRTSPELEMKKMAFAGADRIFQIARSFRNAEHDPTHRPEFDMLEWYSRGTGYGGAMRQAEDLLRAIARPGRVLFRGRKIGLRGGYERIRVRDLFRETTGIDLAAVQDRAAFLDAARKAGSGHLRPEASWDTIFFVLFLDKVEPELARMDRPVILQDHPVQVASLARTVPGDPAFVERFEICVSGLELCNGYSEMTGLPEHRERLELVNGQRRMEGFGDLALPEDFLASLPAERMTLSGVALGMDRLAMVLTGTDSLDGIVPFDPFSGG
jgi:lysyl-tRNA synthetase class 2